MNCLRLNFSPDFVVEEEDWNCWFWPLSWNHHQNLSLDKLPSNPLQAIVPFRLNYDINHSSAVDHKTKFMKELHKLIRDIFPKGKFQNKMYQNCWVIWTLPLLKKLNVFWLAPIHIWSPHVVSTGAVNQASQQPCCGHFFPSFIPQPLSDGDTVAARPLVPRRYHGAWWRQMRMLGVLCSVKRIPNHWSCMLHL